MNYFKTNYHVIFSLLIFGSVLIFHYPFSQLIILMLEFIVILEVIKMIDEFIRKKKIRLRYAIDSFIVFIIRDIIIFITHDEKDKETILFLALIVFIFFIFRVLTIIASPSLFLKKKK